MLSPVTLTGELVTLEPLRPDHHDDLVAAASDGRLWELWYTSVPSPETMRADIARKLAEPTTLPFTVRRNDTGAVVGMTTYLNAEPDVPRLEIGATWTAASAQRTGVNAESKLLLLTHAFEALGCLRGRVPHALAQPAVPDGDRPAGREAGRRPAQPPPPARRLAARHGRVLDRGHRVARRPRRSAAPARSTLTG